jgi:hypothetical protein
MEGVERLPPSIENNQQECCVYIQIKEREMSRMPSLLRWLMSRLMREEKPKPKNLGVRVKITWSEKSPFPKVGVMSQEYRNVTEIHYRFPPFRETVAFESDIHNTGCCIPIYFIEEFETTPEEERAASF